uniref:Uncharacterized protein n=1 Tax=Arundo donax TaxID=35708 RepID=A0A0A9FUH8_ARUDO
MLRAVEHIGKWMRWVKTEPKKSILRWICRELHRTMP